MVGRIVVPSLRLAHSAHEPLVGPEHSVRLRHAYLLWHKTVLALARLLLGADCSTLSLLQACQDPFLACFVGQCEQE